MRILMMTNTYTPITGGLERSVETFSGEYRRLGHEVLIVAPEHKDAPRPEPGVVRVPAIQNFNGTDFSVELPIHFRLLRSLDDFQPQIVHSHHPFLIGDTAVRIAERYGIPLVFTHHTLYEEYTHYVPLQAKALKQFVRRLATEYGNLCDHVFAPSESIARLIKQRGVTTAMDVLPTGIAVERFSRGDGGALRARLGIGPEVPLIGTVGRMAPEKNIDFLARAMNRFLQQDRQAEFLAVGDGPSLSQVKERFQRAGLSRRLHCVGTLSGQDLIDAYHALDVFVFASHSETQGLVLVEAMAAGAPVVAVDAPGVREVVRDGENGRLLAGDDEEAFGQALGWFLALPAERQDELRRQARATASRFDRAQLAGQALAVYDRLVRQNGDGRSFSPDPWRETLRLIKAEIKLAKTFTRATSATLNSD